MKLLSTPRQPFVGLALMAGMGIILAEFFPLSSSALVATALIIVLCAVALLCWPRLIATYVTVGAGFFLLHSLRTSNTDGQQLAAELSKTGDNRHARSGKSAGGVIQNSAMN